MSDRYYSHFTDNTVFYDNKKPSAVVELVECGTKIIGTNRVPNLFGKVETINHRPLSGFPTESGPVRLVATSLTRWAPGEIVTVTGPFSGDNGKRLELKGNLTNQVAIFQERVNN